MTTITFEQVLRVIMPSSWCGISFGRDMFVLVDDGTTKVVTVPGHTFWSSMMRPHDYCPASITILRPHDDPVGLRYRDLCEGRVSKKKIAALAEKLGAGFGAPEHGKAIADAVYKAYRTHTTMMVKIKEA